MAEKHIHKLKRHTYKSGNQIYMCVLDCSYKISTALAVGKRSICNRCGVEFSLTEYSVRLAKPHCEACHKPKNQLLDIDGISDEIKVFIPEQPAVTDLRSRLNALKLPSKPSILEKDDEI